MKKTILVSLVAVMMLFAFIACEQTPIEMPKTVISASIRQEGTFLVGQPFDASKFVVDVTYSDGSVVPLTGTNVTVSTSANSVTNGMKVEAVAGKDHQGNDVKVSTSLVAYSIKSLTVTGPATVSSVDGKVAAPKVSDLKAVATYVDSTGTAQTYNLDASDLGIITSGNGAAAFVDSDVTAVSADKPTAAATVTVYVKWQSGANGVFNYTVQYAGDDEPTPAAEYEWYNNMVVYSVTAPAANGPEYIARGKFDANTMLKFYKVMVDKNVDSPSATDYRFEELVPAQGETLTAKLASTSALDAKDNADRFGSGVTTSGATIDFSYWYISNEATGALSEMTSVSGSVVLNDKAEKDGSIGGTITQGATVTIPTANFIADYAESVACAYVAGTPISGGTSYGQTNVPINVTRWASGYVPATPEAASTVGTVTYNPTTSATEGTSEVVAWTFTPTNRYMGYGVVTGNVTVTLSNN